MIHNQEQLEVLNSKNGLVIYKLDNKHLSSYKDPLREAKGWVSKHHEALSTINALIIIGAGSGYHIVEVVKEYNIKNIIVFDDSAELIANLKANFQDLMVDVYLKHIDSPKSLMGDSNLISLLNDNFKVLDFNIVNRPSLYNLKMFLLGRTEDGLCFLREAIKPYSALELKQSNLSDLVSIKELTVSSEGSLKPDLRLQWKLNLLKELVKP